MLLLLSFMSVPEASMYEDNGLVAGENDVRAAGEFAVVCGVDRKAVAGAVEQAAELYLRLGVAAFNP